MHKVAEKYAETYVENNVETCIQVDVDATMADGKFGFYSKILNF